MYIGIDLGGTNIAAGVVDEAGHIIYKSSVLTLAQRPIEEIVEDMQADKESMMHKWVEENGEVSGRTAFDCAKKGDKTATAVVEQYIRYVGMGLISILNIFQPSKILIGGGISKEGNYLLNPLREYVYAGDYNKYREKTKIEAATLFNDAGIIGAALSVCN